LKNWSLPPFFEVNALTGKAVAFQVHHLPGSVIGEEHRFALSLKLREERRTGAGAEPLQSLLADFADVPGVGHGRRAQFRKRRRHSRNASNGRLPRHD
jgi:hypothetical protein